MNSKNPILISKTQKIILMLGENIKLAILRRKYSTQQVAERVNISIPTLLSIDQMNII